METHEHLAGEGLEVEQYGLHLLVVLDAAVDGDTGCANAATHRHFAGDAGARSNNRDGRADVSSRIGVLLSLVKALEEGTLLYGGGRGDIAV